MKNKLILLIALTFFLFDYSVLCQDTPVMPLDSVRDNTENLTSGDLRKLPKSIYQSNVNIDNILEPSLTQINFDEINFPDDNSITISPNRYANISFYSPFAGNNTYLTHVTSYSYPNSLIVGFTVYNPQTNFYDIYSNDRTVVEFAHPSRDVSFLWGRMSNSNHSVGWIDIYDPDNQLTATVTVNLPSNWAIISLNPVSQNIKKLVLRRPTNANSLYGHILIDNFQFTPIPTQSPIGTLESVSIQNGAAVGWSADPDSQSASNVVHCYVDGFNPSNFIGAANANLPGAGAPYPGNHRFSLPIPVQYRDGNNHQITCYGLDVTGGDSPGTLAGSPKTFKFNAPIGWIGNISSATENTTNPVSDGIVDGWTMDTDVPSRSNFVHFYIDGQAGTGTYIGEAFANIPRPDVNQQTQLPGDHGYEFPIPDQYRNGVQHTIYAYGIDLTGDYPRLLQGSPKIFTLYPRILSVVLEPIDSPIDFNPNLGAGRRIFPDRQTPNDITNRKKVLVKATILPARANERVFFKNFDLDDPSADIAPVDTNANQGNDNRGERDANGNWTSASAGTFNLTGSCNSDQNGISCLTDSNGVATIEFLTTMQPGDNFSVAASTSASYLNGITVSGLDLMDTNSGIISQTPFVPPARAKRTEMLTVWRKLHIEADSMGNVGVGNNVQGTVIADGSRINPGNFPIQVTTASPLEINRFENGRVNIGGDFYKVNVNNANVIQIVVTTSIRIQNGTDFTLYDDDDYNADDPNNPDGDTNEAILQPPNSFSYLSDSLLGDTSGNRNILSSAYILPEYQWAINSQYNQNNLQFELNVEDGVNNATVIGVVNRNRDSINSEREDFWVSYVLMGYQGPLEEDIDGYGNDTILDPARNGVSPSQSIVGLEIPRCDCYVSNNCPVGGVICQVNGQSRIPRGAFGSIIFQEVLQDIRQYFIAPPPPITPRDLDQIKLTVPHEMAHQFGCLGDQRRTTFKLMDYSNYINNTINEEAFHPEHINIMRWRVRSPGN